MREDIVEMTKRELERWQVIQRVRLGELTQDLAGEILGISERQIRRLVKKVKLLGARGLVHGSRGKESPRKIPEGIENRIVGIIRSKYPDFSPLYAAEKLKERHRIQVSRETVRQMMMSHGLWKRKRRRREAHVWRERKHHAGEMVQMDGSHHAWLEDRGPRFVLMGYVDDATGRFYGRFYDHEGVFPAMDSLRRYIELYGLPLAIYLDKHSTYKTTRQADMEELLKDRQAETQFERALGELGIRVIHAHSPQAKGRVERVFQTLQDRLVKEMRLAEVGTLAGANRFLDRYLVSFNRRFMKEALEEGDLHRPQPKSVALEDILCIKGLRTINAGYLIRWRGQTYVLRKRSLTVRRQKVMVLDRFDGRLSFRFKGRDLEYRPAPEPKPALPRLAAVKTRPNPPKYIPPPEHPWRHMTFGAGYGR